MIRFFVLLGFFCAAVPGFSFREVGIASWYGGKFIGRKTANGEIFSADGMTAAHRKLPFNTLVSVKNLSNNRVIQVRINDRGPYVKGRIIDLSRAASEKLGMMKTGTAKVVLSAEGVPDRKPNSFQVYVGAFRSFKNALRLKEKLVNLNLHPNVLLDNKGIIRIVLEEIPSGQIFRVHQTLKENGILNAFIRQL